MNTAQLVIGLLTALIEHLQEMGPRAKGLSGAGAARGPPAVEIEALGGPYGVLIVERSRGATRTLRNGSRLRMELGTDESVILKCEDWHEPKTDPVPQSRV